MGATISIHGRLLGIDSETGAFTRGLDAFDQDEGTTAASTAANLKFRGVTTLGSSAAKDYTINAPAAAGLRKSLTTTTTSTLARTVSLASGNFQSTAGSSFIKATFNGIGQVLNLQAVSTALVAVLGNIGVTLST